jgi:phosphonopyruvate decarboxylase
MIDQVALMEVVEQYRDNGIVVPTMTGSRGWNEVSKNKNRDIPLGGAMGKASSFALGVALAQPDKRVIIFDGDGSLLMNLGTLVTIAEKAPKNLYHFVLENGVYAITGGQPIPGNNKISFAGMAKEAGYASAFEFDDLEDFASRASEVMSTEGPVFICVKTTPEIQNEPMGLRAPSVVKPTKAAIQDLMQDLGV